MKTFLKSLCVGFVIAILFTFVPFEGECRDISNQVLRVHILANSDSEEDQALKLKVRDAVISESEKLFCDIHSKEDALTVLENNLPKLTSVAQQVVLEEGFDYPVTACVKNILFDTRYYEDVTMPGGFYDALQVRIGDALGKNWWCVMYPSLCIYSDSSNDTLDSKLSDKQNHIVKSQGDFEFRLKFLEVFNNIIDFFS